MISNKGMFSVKNITEFKSILGKLIESNDLRIKSGELNTSYISNNTGAVEEIVKHLNKS